MKIINLKGLITIKDIEKIKKYPLACKDSARDDCGSGQRWASSTGKRGSDALLAAGVDVIVIDTSHGHSEGVLDAVR